MEIRRSTLSDIHKIERLVLTCFGVREEPYTHVDGAYYLLFEGDVLVAMTGLVSDTGYDGLEVWWACTLPEYRHKGYMQALFAEMLKDVRENVYCSCWRVADNERVNMHTLMGMFGFECVLRPRVAFMSPHNCSYRSSVECVNYGGVGCHCYEDLYLRRAIHQLGCVKFEFRLSISL